MNHGMLDIETLSTDSDAFILSIGGVVFEPFDDFIGNDFYQVCSTKMEQTGAHIDPETVRFWLEQAEQSPGAVSNLLSMDKSPLPTVLGRLDNWVATNKIERIWANGVNFDITILTSAYKRVLGRKPPWKYNAGLCMRPLRWLSQELELDLPKHKNTCKHDALEDARFQAQCVQNFMKALKNVANG